MIRFIGLWRWYINITITILEFIHRPVFYLKHKVSETEFCFRLQVEPIQFGPDRQSYSLSPDIGCCPKEETSSIYWTQLSMFDMKTGTEFSWEDEFDRTCSMPAHNIRDVLNSTVLLPVIYVRTIPPTSNPIQFSSGAITNLGLFLHSSLCTPELLLQCGKMKLIQQAGYLPTGVHTSDLNTT
jgi:hypothetical protein